MVSGALFSCPSCYVECEQDWKQCPSCLFPLQRVEGRYRLFQNIGEGSAGRLFLAEDLQENKECALKTLHPELFEQKEVEVRFWREIRVTRQLSSLSKHIIQLLDFGNDEFYGYFYTMEYLEGQTLQEFVDQQSLVSYATLFGLLKPLFEVVHLIHGEGVLHRDLSPKNVFLVKQSDGSFLLKLLDFGVAKALEGTLHSQLTNGALGTPGYIAPEQWRGEAVDAKSDQYALGVLVYKLLVGSPPFENEGDSFLSIMKLMHQHLEEPAPSLCDVRPELHLPSSLNVVVQKALSKDPGMRYPSVAAFWDALSVYAGLERTRIAPTLVPEDPNATLF